jgi:hypothetical protein
MKGGIKLSARDFSSIVRHEVLSMLSLHSAYHAVLASVT